LQFSLFLARTLGRTLHELMHTMTAEEFGLWQYEYRTRPWGEIRNDMMGGIIASTVANVNRGKDTEPFSAYDFIPKYGKKVQEEQPQVETQPAEFFKQF